MFRTVDALHREPKTVLLLFLQDLRFLSTNFNTFSPSQSEVIDAHIQKTPVTSPHHYVAALPCKVRVSAVDENSHYCTHYRVNLCVSAVFAVARCPSVRPSVCLSRWCILSIRLNISSNFFVGPVAPSF